MTLKPNKVYVLKYMSGWWPSKCHYVARACANCAIDEWWQLVVPQLDSVRRTMSFQRDDFFLFATHNAKIYFENFDSCIDDQSPFSFLLSWKKRFSSQEFFHFSMINGVFWHIFQLEKLRRRGAWGEIGSTRWDLQRNVRVLRCEKECLPGFL